VGKKTGWKSNIWGRERRTGGGGAHMELLWFLQEEVDVIGVA